MQHILIVEDNQNQLSMLTDTIKGEYPSWEVDSCYSYNDEKQRTHRETGG